MQNKIMPKVKSMKYYLLYAGLILMMAALTQECTALEANVLVVKGTNISMNLTPDYEVSYVTAPSQQEGSFGQMILINNTMDKTKTAGLMILSFSDKSMLEADASEASNFLEDTIFGAFKLAGAKETDSFNLTNHYKNNVTIHALLMPKSGNSKLNELQYMGLWGFDKLNYFFIFSSEKNLTRDIIESLEVKDLNR